jgi:RNA polymerase sigma factor (sigma-70 family)
VPDSFTTLRYWLDRLRQGDPAARNELLRHSRDRLRLLTLQMLRRFPGVQQWEDTSDTLQKALVRLDRALGEVHPTAPRDFLRLAATQIRRELIDLSRRRPPDLPGSEPMAEAPSANGDDPYQLSLWTEFHRRIAEMPEEDRELIELLYYQGLSQPAAAQLLGVPLTTLKRHWNETRVRLLIQLGGVLPG